jgi:hypothetical protein
MRKELPMSKQIKADLDQVVEAVVESMPSYKDVKEYCKENVDSEDVRSFIEGSNFIKNECASIIRTALEQFVVEDEQIPSDILEYVDDIMHLKGLIISGKHGLFDKYKKELIEKINDIEYTTPTKGGSNG